MIQMVNCSKAVFKEKFRDRKCYCFGAGEAFEKYLKTEHWLPVYGVIDNYKAGQEIYLESEKYTIKILSVKEFCSMCDSECIILITSQYYLEMVRQLDAQRELDGIYCFIRFFLASYVEAYAGKVLNAGSRELIPKKIHYCWFGKKPLPEQFAYYISTWKKYSPEYEIIRWDETNYDVTKCAYMKEAYESEKWAFVSDYARVDIIYEYGGIYLDTDIEMIKSFDTLLGWKLFCGFESEEHIAWGLGFGAVKGHPYLRELLEIYQKEKFINPDGSYNLKACPIYQSELLEKHGFIMNDEFQEKNGVVLYPRDFFCPFRFYEGLGQVTENTYSIHRYAGTWLENNGVEKNKTVESVNQLLSRSIKVE